MARPFDSFVVFAEMRTGSNFLEASLNQIPGVTCHGEAFNPHFICYPKWSEALGVTLDQRQRNPRKLLNRIHAEEGLNGFRFFHDHDPRVLDGVLSDDRCAKIVLTRNPLESYVSLKIARKTGQWKLGDAKHRKDARVEFDAEEFNQHLETLQTFQLRLMQALQVTGQTAFYLDYEDLNDVAVLNGLAAFLGKPDGLTATSRALVKQNPDPIEEKVTNPADIAATLARIDRFNLSRTPSFEPRRGPAVPTFIAAPDRGLLYMPIKAGPTAQIEHWLAAMDGKTPRDLHRQFTQKTLRQWMRQTPGHRSFTILRHPVARAHAAFCTYILNGEYAEIREVLRKRYRLPIPPLDRVGKMRLPAHRTAFLEFLQFLKGNLAGQTSIRVDAAWASQTAVLRGFAQFAQPDLIAREDRLDKDLSYLVAQTDADSAALPQVEDTAPFPLSEVYDDTIEAAAAETYQRDYTAFGFGSWLPA